ncbi:MAG: hypothetical protein IKH01_10810 [Prevotella sp.]|nr:hypothetical protein [Prevotella sp.]
MTLDDRIERDLKDLYNNGSINGEISSARTLQGVINDKLSTKGMPTHYTGNRNASTVFVTLNPGSYAYDKNKKGKTIYGSDNPIALENEIKKLQIDTSSESKFIESYKDGKTNFGELTLGGNSAKNAPDRFDVKQAVFFKEWNGSGIFPKGFPVDNSTAAKEVLMNKLQLELIPYCSGKFESKKDKMGLYPFLETLFEEIFRKKRTYIVFSSAIFEKLFDNSVEMNKIGASLLGKNTIIPLKPFKKQDGSDSTYSFRCVKIKIRFRNNEYKAMIAPSFFCQGVAGDLLCQYGEFCYKEYIK